MAFTTEFVMGAGGGVEEIPVSMTVSGSGTVYTLATVDAGTGAVILVAGTINAASTGSSTRPYLQIGALTHSEPHTYLTGPTGMGIGVRATGTVQVAVLSRSPLDTSFTGTVYVAHL